MVTASYDLSAYSSATFSMDVATFGSGTNNPARILYSNNGTTWTSAGVTATPTSSTYIASGNIIIPGPFSSTFYISIANNGAAGRGVRMTNIKLLASGSVCTAPTTQATAQASSSITANALTANWTRGNGNNVLVVARLAATSAVPPASGTSYTADPAFGNSTAGYTTGTGNYVVYNGTGTSVNITALTTNTNYAYDVYEYNTTGTCYLLPASTQTATTTCVAPTTQAVFTTTTPIHNAVSLALTAGNGGGRVVKINNTNSFTVMANANNPTASLAYTGSGEQVVYNGTGTSVGPITGLIPNTTYYLAVYEFNCTGYLYLNPANYTSFTTTAAPTEGVQLTSVNTASVIDFDHTISGSNTDAYAASATGAIVPMQNVSGTLNAYTWDATVSSISTDPTFGNTLNGNGIANPGVSSTGFYGMNANGGVAFGIQPASTTFTNGGALYLKIQNKTSVNLTKLTIAYTVLTYNDQPRATAINFGYNTTATAATFTALPELAVVSPLVATGVLDSNYRVADIDLSATPVAANGYVYVRWVIADAGGSGSRDEIGLDNIQVMMNGTTANATMPAGTWSTAKFSGDADLTGAAKVMDTATFNNGIVTTSATNLLTVDSAAIVSGGSTSAYVYGPMAVRRTTGGNMIYLPLGADGLYRKVQLTPAITGTFPTVYTGWYHHLTPSSRTNLQAGLARVSYTEYWDLTQSVGSTNADVELFWGAASGVLTPADIVMAHYNGTLWENLGGTVATGSTTASGSVLVNGVSSFSPFTLGATVGTALPVQNTKLSAWQYNHTNIISWVSADESAIAAYAVERSTDQLHYNTIAHQLANGSTTNHQIVDYYPRAGNNFYRIAIQLKNGSMAYSDVVKVNGNKQDFTFTVAPNPASGILHVSVSGNVGTGAAITLMDFTGRIVRQMHFEAPTTTLSLKNLSTGIYLLEFKDAANKKVLKIEVR